MRKLQRFFKTILFLLWSLISQRRKLTTINNKIIFHSLFIYRQVAMALEINLFSHLVNENFLIQPFSYDVENMKIYIHKILSVDKICPWLDVNKFFAIVFSLFLFTQSIRPYYCIIVIL